MTAALEHLNETLGLTPRRAAGAVVASHCGSAARMTLCDEANLNVDDAQAPMARAVETILDAVFRGQARS
jgi:hypothetical protein